MNCSITLERPTAPHRARLYRLVEHIALYNPAPQVLALARKEADASTTTSSAPNIFSWD